MNAGISIPRSSIREFQNALQLYGKATKKDESDILNRAGRNTSMRASQFTPRAAGSAIRAELLRGKLAIRILSARRRYKGIPMSERGAVTRKFIASRVRSARYVAVAGWSNAIKAFGGRGGPVNARSQAAKGYGRTASPARLVAILANNARGSDKVALPALEKAINFVARDMRSFAIRKLERTARRFSAK